MQAAGVRGSSPTVFFTGTAGASPAERAPQASNPVANRGLLLALRARGGRDTRAPSD
jgi:hypothetical protein